MGLVREKGDAERGLYEGAVSRAEVTIDAGIGADAGAEYELSCRGCGGGSSMEDDEIRSVKRGVSVTSRSSITLYVLA